MKNQKKDYRDRKKEDSTTVLLYGKHPVLEALKNKNRIIRKLYCTKNSSNFINENFDSEKVKSFNIEILRPEQIDKVLKGSNITHQGIVLETERLKQPDIKTLVNEDLLIACNKITDPHNIGAIIRNALAFGASAVITDERNSPPENATIAKTSAGCIEQIPYVRGKGLSSMVKLLKSEGYLIIGLDGYAEETIEEVSYKIRDEKILLIIGSEGSGMNENIIKMCDYVTKINISDKAESLNASVASAIALFSLSLKQKRG